jgi:hypothetical protein
MQEASPSFFNLIISATSQPSECEGLLQLVGIQFITSSASELLQAGRRTLQGVGTGS